MELVDMLDLGSGAVRCGSSSLPTCIKAEEKSSFFLLKIEDKKKVRYNIGTLFCSFDALNKIGENYLHSILNLISFKNHL